MIVLDTCAVIFDALTPERLSPAATATIADGERRGALHVCDISLWEIGMLIAHRRIDPGTDVVTFLRLATAARGMKILPITAEIAAMSSTLDLHGDLADRLIAATALHYRAPLVTSDRRLRDKPELHTIW